MKIAIAALAPLAFATSALAAVPSAPAEKRSAAKVAGQIEFAFGSSRGHAATTQNASTDSGKNSSSSKGSAQNGGKSLK